jgi:4-amino-4-deoxy-L-arabinose transferase-like glycosyltransferase
MQGPDLKEFRKIAVWTVVGSCIVYLIGWFINVMEVDAAQYAAITREMLVRGDYLHFTDRGRDYLDKPPLLFWVSGLSMKIFGINHFAYRLPALLATLLALYSTFRLAELYYGRRIGYLAVCILATTQAVFLINHDVRTDTLLMCWYAFTVWHLAAYLETRKAIHFILGFVGVGMAMLSKGPIGLVAPALGMGAHLVLKKDWKTIFHPRWVLGALIALVCLLPMSYGLYTQFDLHPDKIVNGQTGVSGLRFFYWTQSFGRITGESVWDNGAGPFFLSHSTLWAFAPWSLFLVLGLIRELRLTARHFFQKKRKKDFFLLFGFLLPFLALSTSRYQLPHYAFVVYPLGAILTARFILPNFCRVHPRIRSLFYTQIVLCLLIVTFVGAVTVFAFDSDVVTLISCAAGLMAILFVGYKGNLKYKLVIICVVTGISANAILNLSFYPNLLRFQAGSEAAALAKTDGLAGDRLYSFTLPYTIDFYSDSFAQGVTSIDQIADKRNIWAVIPQESLSEIEKRRPDVKVLGTVNDYTVSMIRMRFLNPKTRESTLGKYCVIRL